MLTAIEELIFKLHDHVSIRWYVEKPAQNTATKEVEKLPKYCDGFIRSIVLQKYGSLYLLWGIMSFHSFHEDTLFVL